MIIMYARISFFKQKGKLVIKKTSLAANLKKN